MTDNVFKLACAIVPAMLNRNNNKSDYQAIADSFILAEKFADMLAKPETVEKQPEDDVNEKNKEKLRRITIVVRGRGDSTTKCAKIEDILAT